MLIKVMGGGVMLALKILETAQVLGLFWDSDFLDSGLSIS